MAFDAPSSDGRERVSRHQRVHDVIPVAEQVNDHPTRKPALVLGRVAMSAAQLHDLETLRIGSDGHLAGGEHPHLMTAPGQRRGRLHGDALRSSPHLWPGVRVHDGHLHEGNSHRAGEEALTAPPLDGGRFRSQVLRW